MISLYNQGQVKIYIKGTLKTFNMAATALCSNGRWGRLYTHQDKQAVEYAPSRSLSPTMVAEYKLCLPDKALLQQKMRELEEEFDAQVNE